MAMTDPALRVPEVARRLEMPGEDVYELILQGELAAGKGKDGLVYVRESALEDYKRRHPRRPPESRSVLAASADLGVCCVSRRGQVDVDLDRAIASIAADKRNRDVRRRLSLRRVCPDTCPRSETSFCGSPDHGPHSRHVARNDVGLPVRKLSPVVVDVRVADAGSAEVTSRTRRSMSLALDRLSATSHAVNKKDNHNARRNAPGGDATEGPRADNASHDREHDSARRDCDNGR